MGSICEGAETNVPRTKKLPSEALCLPVPVGREQAQGLVMSAQSGSRTACAISVSRTVVKVEGAALQDRRLDIEAAHAEELQLERERRLHVPTAADHTHAYV